MGGAPSKAPSFAPVPTRFGAVDGLGPVRGISRVVDDKGAPCFIAVRPEALDSFSAITADRRKRIRRRGITATASRVDTVYGHVVFVGTADGEVALYDASSLECFKTFAVEGGAGSGGVSVRRAAVTALAPIAKDTLFVGTADGLVRAFSVSKGEAVKLYEGSGSDSEAGADGDAVTGLAAYGIAGGPSMLAVGHRDGRVDSFDVASGSLLLALNAGRGGLSQLLWLSRFNCLATVHSGVNTMTVWDIEVDRCLTLDFSSELASISRSCKLTAAEYDDARGVILFGADDGTVLVRELSRIPTTGDLCVKLQRVCAPAQTLIGTAPACIQTLFYDSSADLLAVGDAGGVVRALAKVTGKEEGAGSEGAGAAGTWASTSGGGGSGAVAASSAASVKARLTSGFVGGHSVSEADAGLAPL